MTGSTTRSPVDVVEGLAVICTRICTRIRTRVDTIPETKRAPSFVKVPQMALLCRFLLVELRGFEPLTPCVQGRCSPAELQPLKLFGGP